MPYMTLEQIVKYKKDPKAYMTKEEILSFECMNFAEQQLFVIDKCLDEFLKYITREKNERTKNN